MTDEERIRISVKIENAKKIIKMYENAIDEDIARYGPIDPAWPRSSYLMFTNEVEIQKRFIRAWETVLNLNSSVTLVK